MAQPSPSHLRSLYRSLLRELPPRPLSSPSPLRSRIRNAFAQPASSNERSGLVKTQEAEQHIKYIQSQRMYATLLERYNPNIDMGDEERVRLTARRVGMNLPQEFKFGGKK